MFLKDMLDLVGPDWAICWLKKGIRFWYIFYLSAKKLKDEFIHNGNRNKHNININFINGDDEDVGDHNTDIIVFLFILFVFAELWVPNMAAILCSSKSWRGIKSSLLPLLSVNRMWLFVSNNLFWLLKTLLIVLV